MIGASVSEPPLVDSTDEVSVSSSLVSAGAYEGRSVQLRTNSLERHLNLNGCDTSLIWTYSQVGSIRCGRA